MKITSLGKKEVVEVPWGVYLWRMPDGKFVGDGDGHFLMISSTKGNQQKMQLLAKAAKECGVITGAPCYFPGNRIVTDEEFEEQKSRMKFGLTPDPLDIASINESRQNNANNRR